MGCVGCRLLAAANRKVLGSFTGAETANLRKDEPHPVAGFSPLSQLLTDLCVHGILRVKKSSQIECIVHMLLRFPGSVRSQGGIPHWGLLPCFYTKERSYA